MSIGNAYETLMLKWACTTDAVTRPTGWRVSLHTADPGEDGTSNELSGNTYARAAATLSVTGNVASNTGAVSFPNTSGVNWSQVTHAGLWDHESTPRFIAGGALSVNKTIEAGDTGNFAAGELTFTLE